MNRTILHWLGSMVVTALLLGAAPARAANLYGNDFRLTDEQGQVVKLSAFAGRNVVVTMEYSRCRFMCSSTFTKLKEIHAAAESNKMPLEILIVSLDPANDTPAQWREYRQMRGLSGNNWHLTSPRPQDMAQIAQLLGIKYWYVGENLVHDFRLLRLNAQGNVVAEMNNFDGDAQRFLR